LKKLISYTALLIVSSISFLSLYLYIDGGNRYNGFRFISESQNLIFKSKLNRSIAQQDFQYAANLLADRINTIRNISDSNNTQTMDYFNSLEKAFNSSIIQKEKKVFVGLLERLNSYYPDNYQLKLMLAQALKNDSYELALEYIDEAIKLIGSSHAAYKLGLELAFVNKNYLKLNEYCSAYEINHHGGKKFVDKDANQLQEINLRRFALNIESADENLFIENNDIQLNKMKVYEFSLPSSIQIIDQQISIILPTISGVMVDISEIRLFSKGLMVQSIANDSFVLSSDSSFFSPNGEILLSARTKPEVIHFLAIDGIKDIYVDRLEFKIKFTKQKLFSNSLCENLYSAT
jgi:hypothetical protein